MDLFSHADAYPRSPGYKREGTSRYAANATKPRAPSIRDRVLTLLAATAMTPDECAGALGLSILAVRPRVTELSRMGLIERTGEVRRNASGLNADVWRARK